MILEIATIRINLTFGDNYNLETDYINRIIGMYKTGVGNNYDFELKTVKSKKSTITTSQHAMEHRNGAFYRETPDSFMFETEEWGSVIYWKKKLMTVMFTGNQNDHHDVLLIRSLKLLVSLLTLERGGLPFHCSAVAARDSNSRSVAFYGPSNAGKTTIALLLGRVWNIYNDEFNIIMPYENNYYLYSTPFTSPEKIVFCSRGSAPLIKLFSLRKGPANKTEQMTQKQKYLSVLESVYTFPTSEKFADYVLKNTDKICKEIPIEMLYFNLTGTICEEIEHFI